MPPSSITIPPRPLDLSYENDDMFIHIHSPHLHHFNRDEQRLVSKLQSSTSNHFAEIEIPRNHQRQRSRSPFDRLAGKVTASMRLYKEASSSRGEKKDIRPHIPRSPSALYTRLSNTATKASRLRSDVAIESRRNSARSRSNSHSRARSRVRSVDRRNKYHNRVPPSCAIPSSPQSVLSSVSFDSKKFAPSSSNFSSGSSFNIPSLDDSEEQDSEELSCNNYEANANNAASQKNGLKRDASFSSRKSFYARLASTNTLSVELSRKVAQAENEVKAHERENRTRGRPAFFGTVSKRSVTPIPGAEKELRDRDRNMQAKKSAPAQQLDNVFRRLSRQDTTTGSIAQSEKSAQRLRERENRSSRGLPTFYVAVSKNSVNSNPSSARELSSRTRSLQPKSKKSDYEMDELFSRLSRQDTVASSKKIVPTQNRPELITEYELQEMQREAKLRMDYRRRRPSQDFFDGLSKDATMSLLLKQYDETHDRGAKETKEESSENQK